MSDYVNLLEQNNAGGGFGGQQMLRLTRGGDQEQCSQSSSVITLSSTEMNMSDVQNNSSIVFNPVARKSSVPPITDGKVRKTKSPTPSRVKDRERRAFAKEQISKLKVMFHDQLKKGNMNDGQVISLAVAKLEQTDQLHAAELQKLKSELDIYKHKCAQAIGAFNQLREKHSHIANENVRKYKVAVIQARYFEKKYKQVCEAHGVPFEQCDVARYLEQFASADMNSQGRPIGVIQQQQQRPVIRYTQQQQLAIQHPSATRYVLQQPTRPISIQRARPTGMMVFTSPAQRANFIRQQQQLKAMNQSSLQTEMRRMHVTAPPPPPPVLPDLSKVKSEEFPSFQVRGFNCEIINRSTESQGLPPPPSTSGMSKKQIFKSDDLYFRSIPMFKNDFFWHGIVGNKEWDSQVCKLLTEAFKNMTSKYDEFVQSEAISAANEKKRKQPPSTRGKKRKRLY